MSHFVGGIHKALEALRWVGRVGKRVVADHHMSRMTIVEH